MSPPAATPPTPAPSWPCEAYGAEGIEIGAWCFFSPRLHERDCPDRARCSARMRGERQRVFHRINELAAAGDPTMGYLAAELPTPGHMLGGGLDGEEE